MSFFNEEDVHCAVELYEQCECAALKQARLDSTQRIAFHWLLWGKGAWFGPADWFCCHFLYPHMLHTQTTSSCSDARTLLLHTSCGQLDLLSRSVPFRSPFHFIPSPPPFSTVLRRAQKFLDKEYRTTIPGFTVKSTQQIMPLFITCYSRRRTDSFITTGGSENVSIYLWVIFLLFIFMMSPDSHRPITQQSESQRRVD